MSEKPERFLRRWFDRPARAMRPYPWLVVVLWVEFYAWMTWPTPPGSIWWQWPVMFWLYLLLLHFGFNYTRFQHEDDKRARRCEEDE